MTATRYTVTSAADGYNIEPFDMRFVPGPVEVVLASEYDVLRELLREAQPFVYGLTRNDDLRDRIDAALGEKP